MIRNSRLIAMALLIGNAAMASALSFFAASIGTYDNSFGWHYTTAETVFAYVDPFTDPVTLDFDAIYGGVGISGGTAVYDDGIGGVLTLGIVGGPFVLDGNGWTSSVAGEWYFISGTGAYSNVITGLGTWSASYSAPLASLSQTTFVGDLDIVPEPASLAIVALGLGAMVVRRRR